MKIKATFELERELWKKGIEAIAGIDEVGRGSWAGPVVAAAVVFPKFFKPSFNLFDSKMVTQSEREEIAKKIKEVSTVGLGVIGLDSINKLGIGKATQKAFKAAIKSLDIEPQHYLIDAFYIRGWKKANQTAMKHGDRLCASIAAASIIAKVYRDNLMAGLDQKYPGYNFAAHKGYGTTDHQEAIRQLLFSPVHRKSFNLVPTVFPELLI
ncbi:MAG: ribonuclease HII [Candidatus Woykebacteria bacterium RBG_13_40_15]|uniref:Ribonuclease n=1 Tax=Candidatus Woykebacteria bacterium RBG_13_40_15 TaxID=1802593 RepID=A0A1G1W9H1_9BACT|nr:MAG: ribonuclease HII [Candidatus Woykebacteria bacterium RBG_13_40_15]